MSMDCHVNPNYVRLNITEITRATTLSTWMQIVIVILYATNIRGLDLHVYQCTHDEHLQRHRHQLEAEREKARVRLEDAKQRMGGRRGKGEGWGGCG